MLAVEDILTDRVPYPQKESINVNQIILERLDTYYFPPQVVVETHLLPGDLIITADRKKVGRIIGNLLSNAHKKLEELKTGALRIASSIEDDQAVIEIGNSGSIPENIRDKIFSDSRLISSRDGSRGQGLTIVKLFTVMHKGRVEFESDPEKNWTVFRVRLPLQ